MGLAKECYQRAREPGGNRFKGPTVNVQIARALLWRDEMQSLAEDMLRMDWLSLASSWRNCDRCPLSCTRKRVVLGEGRRGADLLIVGEAPGEAEDESGRPFTGPSGALLRRVCRALGIDPVREALITNVVGCRPPRNRRPEPREREACAPRLERMVKLLRPRVVLLLGASAAKWAGLDEVGKHRGALPRESWPPGIMGIDTRGVVLTYHPAFLLRQETKQAKRVALARFVADVRKAREILHAARADDEALRPGIEAAGLNSVHVDEARYMTRDE